MANEKQATKLYKIRNGYTVMKGNKAIKEGNIELTDKEHALQSWKVEEIINGATVPVQEDDNSLEKNIVDEKEETNLDRSVKKSRTFNRVMKSSK